MLKKKQKINGEIELVQSNGLGVLTYQKNKVFVKYVLQGEQVEVIITRKLKEGYLAELLRVVKPSSIRTKVKCPYFQKCGSCNYLHMLYPFELKQKTQEIKQLVSQNRLKLNVHNCEGMDVPYGYRNKLILSFSKNRKNEMVAGFYEPFTHHIVNIDNCLLHDKETNKLIKDLKMIVKKCRLDIYDENTKYGFLRHILVRENQEKKFMVTLVTATKEFRGKKKFVQELLKVNENVETIVQNINSRQTSVVLGDEEVNIYGRGIIYDELNGHKFKISSKSFYQINHSQCEKLYDKALSLLKLNGDETVVDTYCGIGTITLSVASKVKKVIGVELNENAVRDANVNRELNDINNVEFVNDDAGNYMQKLAYKKTKVDVVIMDPARDGSDEKFLDSLLKLQPKQIVYISCNPETQMRDLKHLSKQYNFKDIYLYDMFPRTTHVESVVLLTRKDG